MPYWPSTYYKICVIHRLSQEFRVHISNIHFINKLKKIPLVSSMNDASDWVFFTQIYFLKKNLHTIFTLNIIFVLFHEWKKMRTIIEKILYFPQHHLIRFNFWASRQGRQPGSQMPWIYRQIGEFRKWRVTFPAGRPELKVTTVK